MYESPSNLQEFCLDYICDNISALCEEQTDLDNGHTTLYFKNGDIFFPCNLSDQLLHTICDKKRLDDRTMSLFDANTTNLKRVRIRDAQLTAHGLRVLKSHKIVELEASSLKKLSINDLIGCLGEWTLSNLRLLDVSNSTFMNSSRFCVLVSLSKLRSLQTLNVSYTEFNELGLDIIAQDLTSLESLDISGTAISDLAPLKKCKERMRSLTMYNLRSIQCTHASVENNKAVHSHKQCNTLVLCELTRLRHLDVSDDISVQPFMGFQSTFKVNLLLARAHCFPHLQSLDISGTEDIDENMLREFVSSHSDLQFLGLALTDACDMDMFVDAQHTYKVSGEGNEEQIMEALRRYSTRSVYMQRSMYHLFSITQGYTQARLDIIKLILPAMRSHPKELGVQMAATACLYNLSKQEMGQKIHPKWLVRIVNLTMDAMENFPNHRQLQKNALLTLCSDRILQDVTFDHFRCAHLVMECLCAFDDTSMTRMSVAICGILAAKIPTDQTSLLGAKSIYMNKMLKIVETKMAEASVDITMRFTLSALWNLTDESPQTCEMFLKEGGLDLFLQVLRKYMQEPDESRIQVETKVLGLINNVAEVKHLRPLLLKEVVMETVRDMLSSKHIDVSYFAAGILSHLVSDPECEWGELQGQKQALLAHLESAVLRWEEPQGEMVAYRSFYPFFPLLKRFDLPQVQLWSVWAMKHVCTKHGQRYCPMLVKEGGAQLLLELSQNEGTKPQVAEISAAVLGIITKELGSYWKNTITSS